MSYFVGLAPSSIFGEIIQRVLADAGYTGDGLQDINVSLTGETADLHADMQVGGNLQPNDWLPWFY